MKIIIAPDSYKGSLSALQVAEIVSRAARQVDPHWEIVTFPLADGGEGTVDCILSATGGTRIHSRVHDPLGRRIMADYGIVGDTAVMEMAAASGLPRLLPGERDILRCNTYGTGEMIQDAVWRGYKKILLGIGGSATNDGGMGMASALGVRFLDKSGNALAPLPENLSKVHAIHRQDCDQFLTGITMTVLSDVTNPLLGDRGATRVFGPQKSATPRELAILEEGLTHYAAVIEDGLPNPLPLTKGKLQDVPGAGAAGGLGFGLLAFCHGEIVSGIDSILDLLNFDAHLRDADLVITGEGRIDGQTASGKACKGIARRAKIASVPCIAICGDKTSDADNLLSQGLSEIITLRGTRTTAEAMAQAPELLFTAAMELFQRKKETFRIG